VERLYTHQLPRGIQHKGRPKPMKMTCIIENGVQSYRLEEIAPKPSQERTDFMVHSWPPLLRCLCTAHCANKLITAYHACSNFTDTQPQLHLLGV
jgi:hypothetical protein